MPREHSDIRYAGAESMRVNAEDEVVEWRCHYLSAEAV
jgi:hypothetical protein